MNAELQDTDREFLELVDENRPKILRICRTYAWNREDQDDLFQEILLQIWRSLPGLKDDGHANTWLYRVALNTAISFLRKRAARNARTLPFSHEQIRQYVEDRQPGAEDTGAQLEALYQAIARLDDVEKALITLFLEDLSYEQIADVMGLSPNHAGVLLHRVKKKLAVLTKEIAP